MLYEWEGYYNYYFHVVFVSGCIELYTPSIQTLCRERNLQNHRPWSPLPSPPVDCGCGGSPGHLSTIQQQFEGDPIGTNTSLMTSPQCRDAALKCLSRPGVCLAGPKYASAGCSSRWTKPWPWSSRGLHPCQPERLRIQAINHQNHVFKDNKNTVTNCITPCD